MAAGSPAACPSVSELVNAAHSDLADAYVLVAASRDYRLVFEQARRLLGGRVELVLTESEDQAKKALAAFDGAKTAKENAASMKAAADA